MQHGNVKPMDGFIAFDARVGIIDGWLNLMRKSVHLTLIDTTTKSINILGANGVFLLSIL